MSADPQFHATSGRELAWVVAVVGFLSALFVGRSLFDESVVLVPDSEIPAAGAPGAGELSGYAKRRFAARAVARGEIALWCPDVSMGVESAGDPSFGTFDPGVLVLGALERAGGRALFDRGLAWLVLARLAAAAVGAYLLARRLRLGEASAALVGVAFAGSGAVVVPLHAPFGHAAILAPWLLHAIEGVRASRPSRAIVATAIVTALAIASGSPDSYVPLLTLGILWAAVAAPRGVLGIVLGAAIAAPAWVPVLSLGLTSAGSPQPAAGFDLVVVGLLVFLLGAVLEHRRRAEPRRRELALVAVVVALVVAGIAARHPFLRAQLLVAATLPGAAYEALEPGILAGSIPAVSAAVLALALASIFSGVGVLERRGLVTALAFGALLLAVAVPGAADLTGRIPALPLGAGAAPVSALMLALLAGDALERAGLAARVAAVPLFVVLCAVAGRAPQAPVDAVDPDPLFGLVEAPPARVSEGSLSLAGWVHPGLPLDAVGARLERVDLAEAAEPRGSGRGDSGRGDSGRGDSGRGDVLRLALTTRELPADVDAQNVPAEATLFLCEPVDVAGLAPGRWRFVLELSPEARAAPDALPAERVLAWIRVERRNRWFPGWIVALLVLVAPLRRRWVAWLVVLAVTAELAGQRGVHPPTPREELSPETEVVRRLRAAAGGGRVLGERGLFSADDALVHGLRTVAGPASPSVAAFRASALVPGGDPARDWDATGVDTGAAAFRVLGVRALAVRDAAAGVGSAFERDASELHDASPSGSIGVLRALDPLGDALCISEVVAQPDALLVDSMPFDPTRSAFLAPERQWAPAAPFTAAEVEVVEARSGLWRLRARLDGEGLLVLTERAARGWRCRIDGERRDVWTADGLFLAVPLGAGEHEAEFRYWPPGFSAALVASIAALLGVLVVIVRGDQRLTPM